MCRTLLLILWKGPEYTVRGAVGTKLRGGPQSSYEEKGSGTKFGEDTKRYEVWRNFGNLRKTRNQYRVADEEGAETGTERKPQVPKRHSVCRRRYEVAEVWKGDTKFEESSAKLGRRDEDKGKFVKGKGSKERFGRLLYTIFWTRKREEKRGNNGTKYEN